MPSILAFLAAHQDAIMIIWWATLGLTAFLYLASYLIPAKWIGGVLPFHTAFHADKNADLDFQTIGYAMVHQKWFSRITHGTIFWDAFLWFVVFYYWHWSVAAIVGAVCVG